MSIKDLTDSVRLPRLGKIHLGIKHPEKGYPMKTDYFVFDKEHPDYKKLVEIYGEKPKELRVLIPVEDEEQWASQYYKAYNLTYGLVCKGDGEVAMRMVSVETGKLPDAKKAGTVRLEETPCQGRDCKDYQAKKCHEVMNLRFILPEVPGLGVWQIDTGSINSILNINSCARLIKKAFGRLSMIPLKLTFEPITVNNPETGKKQTVYVLNLRTEVTMAQLAEAARAQSQTFLLDAPDLEAVFDEQVQESINELWPEDKPPEEPVEKSSPQQKEQKAVTPPVVTDIAPEPPDEGEVSGNEEKPSKKEKTNPDDIKNIEGLVKVLKQDFNMSIQEMWDELNIKDWNYLAISLPDAYRQIEVVRG